MGVNIENNAYRLAEKWHEGQLYGDMPYMMHLEAVAKSVYNKNGANHVMIAVALLHDILEDTLCDTSEIIQLCGVEVLDAVIALTKGHGQPYAQYIAQVKANPIALEVKLHDTLANLTASVMSDENGRVRKYARQLQLLLEPS